MRAALDLEHTAMLNQMRIPRPGEPRINAQQIGKLKTLTNNDMVMGANCCNKQQRKTRH